MKKQYFTSIVILTFCITMSYGQGVPFLNYFSDARLAAMGNAGYGLSSPFAVQRNTAAMMSDYTPETELAASCLLWQPQAANSVLINAAGYTKLKNMGFAAGIRRHTLDIVERTDEQGNALGTFTPSEYALEIGAGYKISTNIAVGTNLHYVSSDLGGVKKASAIVADVSMLFSLKNLSAGLGCSSLGFQINYGYSDYELPTRVQAGVAYRFSDKDKHSVTGVADAACQISAYNGAAGGIGVEYTYNNLISLRTGYHFESEVIGASYATIGCGARLSGFFIDLAYMPASGNNPMRQTMIVSLKWGI
jgi:hypothetical protein